MFRWLESRPGKPPPCGYISLISMLSILTLILAACVEDASDTDDSEIDEQPTVEIGTASDASDEDVDRADDGEPSNDNNRTPPYHIETMENTDTGERISIITYGQQPTEQMDALLEGELAWSGECLGIAASQSAEFISVVWPAGYSVSFDDEDAVLLDPTGDPLAREGEMVSVGGGNSPDRDGNITAAAPADCKANSYWMSGAEVRRLAPEVEPEPANANGMTVFFPQWVDETDDNPGAAGGYLTPDNGCLYVDADWFGVTRLPIWPPDFSVRKDGDDVLVLDGDGEVVAQTGDPVEILATHGQFDMDDYGIPGECTGAHSIVYDIMSLSHLDEENGEPRVQTPEEAHEHDAQQYADAFDISLEEALWRLEMQGNLGPVQEHLMENEADRFGGLYWQNEGEFKLVVLMTDGDEDAVLQYIDDPEIEEILEVQTVEFTYEELLDTQQEVKDLLVGLGLQVSGGTSVQKNRVEISVADKAMVEDALEAAGEALPEQVVIVEEETPSTLDSPDEGN